MDREAAVKLWNKTTLGGPITGRAVEAFAVAVEAAERERCAAVLRARIEKIAAEAERAAISEPDEESALRAMAWQLTVAEREILGPN